MEIKHYKKIQNGMLFFTILVLVVGFYIENTYGLEPCPLCLMQRFCIFIIGFFCFISMSLVSIRRANTIAILQVIIAAFGLYFASRQIWLQSFATNDMQICLPAIESIGHYFSSGTLLKSFFLGSSKCSDITWSLLGLSMPSWSAIYFSFLLILNLSIVVVLTHQMYKKEKKV